MVEEANHQAGSATGGQGNTIGVVLAASLLVAYLALFAVGWPAAGVGAEQLRQGGYRFLFVSMLWDMAFRPALLLAVILLSAVCGGLWLLGLLRAGAQTAHERLLFGAGAGLGLLGVLTMVVGSVGTRFLWVLPPLLALAGWKSLRAEIDLILNRRQPTAHSPWPWVCAAAVLPFMLICWAGAQAPPVEYDDLEYHLAVPARCFRDGRVHHIRDNVFANFPLNTEMLHLLSMTLAGGTEPGARLGRLVNLSFALLAMLATAHLCAASTGRKSGYAAGVLWMACPMTAMFVCLASDTLALACYGALALCAVIRMPVTGEQDEPEGQPAGQGAAGRYARIAGVMCGMAMGAKYPALIAVTAPVGVILLLRRLWGAQSGKTLAPVAGFALCAVLCLAPWLVRNAINTGNPCYPFLYGVFGGEGWSEQQAARFDMAHSPARVDPGLLPGRLRDFIFARASDDHHVNPLVVAFIPFALLLLFERRGNGAGRSGEHVPGSSLVLLASGGYFLIAFALWFFFTHQIDRFLAPAVPALAICSALGFTRLERTRARWVGRLLLIPLLAYGLFEHVRTVHQLGGFGTPFGLLTAQEHYENCGLLEHWQAMEYLNEKTPGPSRVMFAGEARTFYARFRPISPTVFDAQPFDAVLAVARDDPWAAAASLREMGVDYIVVNWPELARLQATYGYDCEGRRRPGLYSKLDEGTVEPFRSLQRKCLVLEKSFGEPRPMPAFGNETLPVIEIWSVQRP